MAFAMLFLEFTVFSQTQEKPSKEKMLSLQKSYFEKYKTLISLKQK